MLNTINTTIKKEGVDHTPGFNYEFRVCTLTTEDDYPSKFLINTVEKTVKTDERTRSLGLFKVLTVTTQIRDGGKFLMVHFKRGTTFYMAGFHCKERGDINKVYAVSVSKIPKASRISTSKSPEIPAPVIVDDINVWFLKPPNNTDTFTIEDGVQFASTPENANHH